ncbi:hypothetical protein ACFL3U_02340 [Pseudomonadota bacterium]
MKHKLALISIFLIAQFTSLNSFAKTNTVDKVLEQMISSYGGVEAVEKLNTPYQQIWHLDAVAKNAQGNDLRSIDLPEKLQVELSYPNSSETRILFGDQGLKIYNDTKQVRAEGPGLDAMRLQRMRLYNPLMLQERAADITLSEKDGRYCLTLTENGLVTDYHVNKKTHLIEVVIGTLSMGGMTMQFRTEYHDFKMEAGVIMAHREVKYAGSVNTAELTLLATQFTDEVEELTQLDAIATPKQAYN